MAKLDTATTQEDISCARQLLKQGRLVAMYESLADNGACYATLAKGVGKRASH